MDEEFDFFAFSFLVNGNRPENLISEIIAVLREFDHRDNHNGIKQDIDQTSRDIIGKVPYYSAGFQLLFFHNNLTLTHSSLQSREES